jgi:hypothetical protein
MNQSEFGDTPVSRCRYYRQVCGLPAIVDPPELGRIVIRAGIVWALMMPAHLGQLVKIDLQRRGHDIGPIMSHPRSQRWSYLVRPDLPNDDSLFAEMFRLDVSIVRAGGEIALPSPTDRCALFRHWIEPPRSGARSVHSTPAKPAHCGERRIRKGSERVTFPLRHIAHPQMDRPSPGGAR